MKNKLLFILLSILSCSCGDDRPEPGTQPLPSEQATMAIIDVSGETDQADLMCLTSHGCYMTIDFDHCEGLDMLYINEDPKNEFDKGIALYITPDGTPIKAVCGEYGRFFNENARGGYDCALISPEGEIQYFWDFYSTNVEPAGSLSRGITGLWASIRDTYDEHHRKAFLPALAKMLYFTELAVKATTQYHDIATLLEVLTAITEEIDKSGMIDVKWLRSFSEFTDSPELIDLLLDGDASFTPEMLKFPASLKHLNLWADRKLKEMGRYEPKIDETFKNSEWQIRLSAYILHLNELKSTIYVNVDTKVMWEVAPQNPSCGWCRFGVDGSRLRVEVDAYDGGETRTAKATVKAVAPHPDIKPVTLTVIQDGTYIRVSPDVLEFGADKGSKGVEVRHSPHVRQWRVTSYPQWCKIQQGLNTFFVDVGPTMEDREGLITVTSYDREGVTADATVTVRQTCAPSWDNTEWTFNGSLTASFGSFMSPLTREAAFTLKIGDTSKGEFDIGNAADNMSDVKIKLQPDGTIRCEFSMKVSYGIIGAECAACIIITRQTYDRADADLNGSGRSYTDGIQIPIGLKGSFAGTRDAPPRQ